MADEGRGKLYSLEAGRFVAALMVMFCHVDYFLDAHMADPAVPFFGGVTFPGPLGVQYFFVLSGFVMASAHHGDFGNIAAIPKFWWRRVCRIYPAYWLALSIPVYFAWGTFTPGSFAAVALLSPWHGNDLILAAWSLRYELVFYIMLGLAMLPYAGKPLFVLWVVFTLWRWGLFLPVHPPVFFALNRFVVAHADKFAAIFEVYFFLGLAAGYAYVKCRLHWLVCAALLLGGVVLFFHQLPAEHWGMGYGSPLDTLAMAVALGCALLGLAGLERAKRIRLGRVAGLLGAVSYPLYVLHLPVLQLADHALHGRMLGSIWLYVYFVVLSLVILLLSGLVTFLFDRPVQRWLRRLFRAPAAGVAPLSPLYSTRPGQ